MMWKSEWNAAGESPYRVAQNKKARKSKPRIETTSKRVARIAALILGAEHFSGGLCVYSKKQWNVIRVEDLLAMAGSMVTQAPDKKRSTFLTVSRKVKTAPPFTMSVLIPVKRKRRARRK